MKDLNENIVELYRKTSAELPDDVVNALRKSAKKEKKGSTAEYVLKVILENIKIAGKLQRPICQDTGVPIFYIKHPKNISQEEIKKAILNATRTATAMNYLRPNAVDSITGKNSGSCIGEGIPEIHFEQSNNLEISLMLKGGGSENVSAQYSLPDSEIGAGRDIEGVKKCVIDSVFRAQGNGCPPGIIGVGIGGTRNSSYGAAKKQLMRNLNDMNKDKTLAKLENELLKSINSLGIGPSGLGGRSTALGVKISSLHRAPASFFVSVSYGCWALRRCTMILKNGKWVFN